MLVQAYFQKFIDNSISKTINLDNDASVEDVEKVFKVAYDTGCKSVTVYRDGSRDYQVLHTSNKVENEEDKKENHAHVVAKRPNEVNGTTKRINTAHGKMYVTINSWEYNGEIRPFEVFANIGKEGGDLHSYMSAVTRVVSLALRSGVDIEEVIEQLKGISCHTSWDNGDRIEGPIDGIAHALSVVLR